MNEKQLLKRKMVLKSQALKLIRAERENLKRRVFLLNLKEHLECEMTENFEPQLSLRIDAVNFLLESV